MENTIIKGISREKLDLDKTFDCGQSFRWERLFTGAWKGVVDGKVYYIANEVKDGEEVIITSATEEEWENKLVEYFDLNTNYSKLQISIDDDFANEAMRYGKGIRILKQELWETMISFILSQRSNIPKIKSNIKNMANICGKEVKGKTLVEHSFPTPEEILNKREELKKIGLGYRYDYVIQLAEDVYSGKFNIQELKNEEIPSVGIVEKLKTIRGVGNKVANCIALFGLHRLDMFPIDIWMERVIDRYYEGELDVTKYGSLAGLMQQYMFYYMRSL